MEVNVHNDLDINKIEIIFKNEYQLIKERHYYSHHNPVMLDKMSINRVIFKNGKQLTDIPYDYGKQVLQVLYDGKEIGRLGHWQTNGYHSHRYYIDVYSENKKIIYKGLIEGPDADFYNRRAKYVSHRMASN